MSNDTAGILQYIPQRPPFVMVDGIVESTGETTLSTFVVKADNIFVENGLLKEPGLVENIAQTAAARAGYTAVTENKPVTVGYIGAISNLEIIDFPACGDELITAITVENQIFDVSLIAGKITCKGNIIAHCNMKIFINQIKNN